MSNFRNEAYAILRLMVRWRVAMVGLVLFWTVVTMIGGWQIALGLWVVGFVLTIFYVILMWGHR